MNGERNHKHPIVFFSSFFSQFARFFPDDEEDDDDDDFDVVELDVDDGDCDVGVSMTVISSCLVAMNGVCSENLEPETIFDLGSSFNRRRFVIFEYFDSSSDDSSVGTSDRFLLDSYSPSISILLAIAALVDDDVVVVIVDMDRALHRTGNMPIIKMIFDKREKWRKKLANFQLNQ